MDKKEIEEIFDEFSSSKLKAKRAFVQGLKEMKEQLEKVGSGDIGKKELVLSTNASALAYAVAAFVYHLSEKHGFSLEELMDEFVEIRDMSADRMEKELKSFLSEYKAWQKKESDEDDEEDGDFDDEIISNINK